LGKYVFIARRNPKSGENTSGKGQVNRHFAAEKSLRPAVGAWQEWGRKTVVLCPVEAA
jgi:hypothetical protein